LRQHAKRLDNRPADTAPSRPPAAGAAAGAAPASERVRLRRRRERGSHDRAVIDAILDEALIAHLGVADEHGQPFVIPTLHARCDDLVYCHGSAASRTMRALAAGAPACLTVSLIDGLVLARSAMHHSANYRSAMILGTGRLVEDSGEKRAALRAVVEHIVPGRAAHVREPNAKELRATAVVALPLDEASAKIRDGPPVDDEDDYAMAVWAGIIPLRMQAGEPQPDPRLAHELALPEHVRAYRRTASA
jgi:nitroimidazol reductase NimA-like FMN-containing flavoprotein (pyridoxamine 5'-phosphate oxidase superfamily)